MTPANPPKTLRHRLRSAALAVFALFVLIQIAPYGRNHTNPPVVKEPSWSDATTRPLAVRACFDCHSNETRWPWYSKVAPVSWLVQYDVDKGRRELNFSEWQRSYAEAGEAAETIQEGEMPPAYYTVLHPEARLSPEEKQALARGLSTTLGSSSSERD
jgi:heme-binding protein